MSSFQILNQKDYSNPSICSACGGDCCKGYAGTAWPEQFGAPDIEALRSNLVSALGSGEWAVDRWDGYKGSGNGYFVRPSHVGVQQVVDFSWGGQCVFLGATGCRLPADDRPLGCRLLVPDPSHSCKYKELEGNGKLNSAQAWEPFHKVVEVALQQVNEASSCL